MRRAIVLAALLLASPAAHADAVSRVPGFGRLSESQKKIAREAMGRIDCYHGCTGRIAVCLAAKPRSGTAWRLARYVVFLAGKRLDAELIAKVIERRRQSVKPKTVHDIKPGAAPRLGDARAPPTIVEYADFQCRHCAEVAPVLEKLVRGNKRVALYFKVYPLRFKGPSLVAARAALAAQRQGKFWPMAHLLFADRDAHTEKGVEQLARKAGLDLDRFRASMKDTNLLKQIEANKIEGVRLGLEGTPALFFNGKPHLLRKDEHHLRDRIEEELELLGK